MTEENHPIVEIMRQLNFDLRNVTFSQNSLALTLALKVKPASSKQGLFLGKDQSWFIGCHAPAVDGKANQSVSEILAKVFGLAVRDVVLLRGEHSRTKVFALNFSFRQNKDTAYFLEKIAKVKKKNDD